MPTQFQHFCISRRYVQYDQTRMVLFVRDGPGRHLFGLVFHVQLGVRSIFDLCRIPASVQKLESENDD